jgi:RNA polymerase sigma factor (sigma-70 family)
MAVVPVLRCSIFRPAGINARTMITPDAELLRRYVETGADDAFGELVQRHLKLVYFAAWRRTGDPHLAEEVAQCVFTALACDAAALSRHAVLTGWLYTTTRFTAAKLLRTEQRRRAREQKAYLMQTPNSPAANPPSAEAASWEQMRPMIDAALDGLDARDREAVLLRFFEERPFAQIGAMLQVTEDAARMRVDRALDKLRSLLERRGVTSTSAALGLALANQAMAGSVPASLATSVTSAALTGAATVGVTGSAVAILGFMSTSKIVVAVLAVVGISGIGSAVYENMQVREAESAVAAIRRERDSLQLRVAKLATDAREAAERARASDERVAALQVELTTARSSKTVTRPATESFATTSGGSASSVNPGMEILANPEYARLSVEKYRAELGLQFAPLYKMLGLSPEQIAKFEANRVQFQQAGQEVWSVAVATGVSVSNPAVVDLAKEAITGLEKDLRVMLGEKGYAKYSQYNHAQPSLDVVTALAGNVYRTELPLTAQQGERLVDAVMSHTRAVPVAPGSKSVRYETDWAEVSRQAQAVLASPQMNVFDMVLAAKKIQQQRAAVSATARAAAAKPGG